MHKTMWGPLSDKKIQGGQLGKGTGDRFRYPEAYGSEKHFRAIFGHDFTAMSKLELSMVL